MPLHFEGGGGLRGKLKGMDDVDGVDDMDVVDSYFSRAYWGNR